MQNDPEVNNLHDNTEAGIWVEDDCYDNEFYSNTIVNTYNIPGAAGSQDNHPEQAG